MKFTAQQQQAIAARGNVLVMAGAGTGKTRTLVQRCVNILREETPPVSLDEILMVTFTEAAAAEMRERIRAEIESELARNAASPRWHEQLALFDTAHIGTLHSFCFKLVRQHFYELELDPQLTVLPEAEARLLAEETLDAILKRHYAGDDALADAVQGLIQSQGRGWDKPIRALTLKIHAYSQSLPDPAGWFAGQIQMFEAPEPVRWRGWLREALIEWTRESLAFARSLADRNELAAKVAEVLNDCAARVPSITPGAGLSPEADPAAEAFGAVLEKILAVPDLCPPRKKGALLKPIARLCDEAKFLHSLLPAAGTDPLAEDWGWCRTNMLALLRLAEEFGREFADEKRELGALDFHDLEQHTLRLLWDNAAGQPTPIAREWRGKLRFIFVDEYQDINAAQDKIIEALSRSSGVPEPGDSASETLQAAIPNRFLVGDVKQSIYRFRLANPRIFQNYAAAWESGQGGSAETALDGQVVPLNENFRSREGILNFVNSLFELVMRGDAGGVRYDDRAKLRFGAPEERGALGAAESDGPRVELHLRLTGSETNGENGDTAAAIADMDEAGKEARLVGMRLRELRERQHPVWDDAEKRFRAADWSDMAVLLRSPAAKAEIYAREFAALGVPLVVARGGFFSSMEILDLLSLLQLLDNPLQDVPAIAVLRSPLVGLTLDELANIRLAAMKVPFWTAVQRWTDGAQAELEKKSATDQTAASARSPASDAAPYSKVSAFLDRFSRWRKLARQASLSHCIEAVLAETHYAEWLLTQSRGEQRRANVRRLLHLAQQFDQFQRQGLFRFLRFIEAQREAEVEPEVAADAEQNAVRLMSVHQSKGLEFPVVALADLSKQFNESDLRADVILDEIYGLCPRIKPPRSGARYPSLPWWLARRRQKTEMLGEELRLLYVATTRARDTLILTANVAGKKFQSDWISPANAANPLDARSFADWLAAWFAAIGAGNETGGGRLPLLHWKIWDDAKLATVEQAKAEAGNESEFTGDAGLFERLGRRINWKYPHGPATEQAAKVSVTAIRREAMAIAENEAESLFESRRKPRSDRRPKPKSLRSGKAKASAAEIGTAHHRFLQFVSLDQTASLEVLASEAERMVREGFLTRAEINAVDLDALSAFWNSPLGRNIRAHAASVHRELEFTARFPVGEIAAITGRQELAWADEFVVVQGVADLAVILENEIWIVDFKTDEVAPRELPEKVKTYAPQLKLYALALARIYRRPVKSCWLHFLAARQSVEMEGAVSEVNHGAGREPAQP